jgi:hypothetical protein
MHNLDLERIVSIALNDPDRAKALLAQHLEHFQAENAKLLEKLLNRAKKSENQHWEDMTAIHEISGRVAKLPPPWSPGGRKPKVIVAKPRSEF